MLAEVFLRKDHFFSVQFSHPPTPSILAVRYIYMYMYTKKSKRRAGLKVEEKLKNSTMSESTRKSRKPQIVTNGPKRHPCVCVLEDNVGFKKHDTSQSPRNWMREVGQFPIWSARASALLWLGIYSYLYGKAQEAKLARLSARLFARFGPFLFGAEEGSWSSRVRFRSPRDDSFCIVRFVCY